MKRITLVLMALLGVGIVVPTQVSAERPDICEVVGESPSYTLQICTSDTTTTTSTTTTTFPTTTTTVFPTTTTTTTVPDQGCSGGPGEPGSPDGFGGCFPGLGRVGVPIGLLLTPYSGSCILNVANTTLDGYDFINCPDGLLIRANNISITRSKIYTAVHGREDNQTAFSISDSLIDGRQANGYAVRDGGVDGWNFALTRVEIVNTNRGAYCQYYCLVQDSWVHGTTLDPNSDAHASGFRVEQYATLIHNTIHCDFTGPYINPEVGCSADISGYPDFVPIHHNTLTNNLFRANSIGAGFCVYGGGTNGKPFSNDPLNATYVVYVGNVFERGSNNKCGAYGPVTDFQIGNTGNQWTDNFWSDGGVVNPE